jgi:mRNA-degrading endonuclease RelE of RelBE toxin-antitoxin system
MAVRPYLKGVAISKHFVKDLKDEEQAKSIVNEVLDCSGADFTELHKFEENIDGNLVFRAKKGGVHVVYSVDRNMRIAFLRAFRNYSEYTRFLGDKKEIRKAIAHA